MKHFYLAFSFFLVTIFSIQKTNAQLEKFYPDSILSYSLNSLDTSSKIPVKKVVNRYSSDFKLQARHQYRWDMKSKHWERVKRLDIHYYPTEILVEAYQMMSNGTEAHTGRLLLKLDSTGKKIIQTTYLVKDKNKESYNRFTQIEYKYKKDTLIEAKRYQQGSTYFLEQETKFTRLSKSTWTEKHKTFKEPEMLAIDSSLKTTLFSGGNVTLTRLQLFSSRPSASKDTFVYNKNKKLEYTRHINLNSPKGVTELNHENYRTTYIYSNKDKPGISITFVEDEKGIRKQHVKNQLVFYYCSGNSPVRKQVSYQVELEDQLLAFNELN